MSNLAERCMFLIAKQKTLPVEEVNPGRSLEDLQFDSLDKVSLVFDIEETFHIKVTDAELASLRTVGEIIEGVERKVAETEGAKA